MIEMIVNVIIFKTCEKNFTSFLQKHIHHAFPAIRRCMIYEKKRDLLLSTTNNHVSVCEMLPHVIYRYCLMRVWSVVISNKIMLSIGVLVSMFRLCQNIFLSRRKCLTLNHLELYQELRSSHIQKFYELNQLMPEYYHPGEQSEMKSFDVKSGLLMDLGC